MKRVAGFALFFVAIGMLITMFLENTFWTVMLILICITAGYFSSLLIGKTGESSPLFFLFVKLAFEQKKSLYLIIYQNDKIQALF
ncbi:MAG: hypothetical protein ACLRUZ_11645 [Faecalimonas sp.]